MSRFLLEIGTEEIPDWMIVAALNQLQDHLQTFFDQNSLAGRVSRTEGTPRRLVLFAEDLLARQADADELLMGPPKSAGAGAAAGFARKMGVAADQLSVETTAKASISRSAKLFRGGRLPMFWRRRCRS